MKALVAVKRVIDPYVKIRVKADQSGVENQQVKMSMNPFDEIALEEAIRLKEKNLISEIIVVSVGPSAAQEVLRHGLALGADSAILIETDESLSSLDIAKILKKIIENEAPKLVFLVKQSIDGDNNQTPQMLAGLLQWPQATFISKIQMEAESLVVVREVDGGLETLRLSLPAVISSDLRLNQPRYASLPNIMKAKQKKLTITLLNDLNLALKTQQRIVSVKSPLSRQAGVLVDSVEVLVDKLKNEAKVL